MTPSGLPWASLRKLFSRQMRIETGTPTQPRAGWRERRCPTPTADDIFAMRGVMMAMSRCALTAILCLTLSGLPSLAQSAGAQAQGQEPAAAAPAGPPPVPLTLAEAVSMSLKSNLDIRTARITPMIREQEILLEEAPFDPNVGGFAEWQDNSTPTQNVFDIDPTDIPTSGL